MATMAVSVDVVPAGWKTNDIFGYVALREQLLKAERLPMFGLDRAIPMGECPFPENSPGRARDYSHIGETEWKLPTPDKPESNSSCERFYPVRAG